jgi:molybdopterin synthase catalytic subunit
MSEGMHHIKVLFFAHLRELTGTREIGIEIPDYFTIGNLKEVLINQYPSLEKAMDHLIAAVNQNFAQDEMIIPETAEVAFFPPVSGGGVIEKTICRIVVDEINVNQTQQEITSQYTGGICSFTGVVRGKSPHSKISQTVKLEYEAYKPMAEAKMLEIAFAMRKRWPDLEGIAIVQRIGVVTPGTPVVVVSCSACHRNEGIFEAARYGIDRLKEIVPVWKKEIGPDGEEWIEGSYFPEVENGV